jgi:hypothetical protein
MLCSIKKLFWLLSSVFINRTSLTQSHVPAYFEDMLALGNPDPEVNKY